MNRPIPAPSQEGSRHPSALCPFPSWAGSGAGSWSQCMRKNERRLSTNTRDNKSFFVVRTNIRVRSSNLAAIKEPGEPDIAGNPGGKSVWWQWQAPRTGPVTISTLGSSFDTLLGVYTGTAISNLVLVASNDDAKGALTSGVTFQALAGTSYQIAVDGVDGASGEIVLTLIVDPPRLCLPVTVLSEQVRFCI